MSDLNLNTFKARRAEAIKRMEKNSVLVISSAKLVSRNNDIPSPTLGGICDAKGAQLPRRGREVPATTPPPSPTRFGIIIS